MGVPTFAVQGTVEFEPKVSGLVISSLFSTHRRVLGFFAFSGLKGRICKEIGLCNFLSFPNNTFCDVSKYSRHLV